MTQYETVNKSNPSPVEALQITEEDLMIAGQIVTNSVSTARERREANERTYQVMKAAEEARPAAP